MPATFNGTPDKTGILLFGSFSIKVVGDLLAIVPASCATFPPAAMARNLRMMFDQQLSFQPKSSGCHGLFLLCIPTGLKYIYIFFSSAASLVKNICPCVYHLKTGLRKCVVSGPSGLFDPTVAGGTECSHVPST